MFAYLKKFISKPSSSKVICVLGMHRSGTSCLSGSLENGGVILGKVSQSNPYNQKGNRELDSIMKLNDNILMYNHSSWDIPPMSLLWNNSLRRKRNAIIKLFKGIPLWGFKDPRTLITLPFWLEGIPKMDYIATIRHPFLVAKSLAYRNSFAINKSLNLWFIYNSKLLEYHDIYHFPIISFDVNPDLYHQSLLAGFEQLGLNNSNQFENNFFEKELRHYYLEQEYELPEKIAILYNNLLKRTIILN